MHRFRFHALALPVLLAAGLPLAHAMTPMDARGIEQALRHGLENQGLGFATLLGPNWIEGPEGMLLNIYSPFMMLAAQAARSGLPENPTPEDLKEARKRCAREIRHITDPQAKHRVKFSVAMFGDTPDFALKYNARIEGVGRGREFRLKTATEFRQAQAVMPEDARRYEAVNAYYFNVSDLENIDEFSFILEPMDGSATPIVFRVNNRRIY